MSDDPSPEQLAESERANEEFISAPEDTVENPLVPGKEGEEEVDVSKMEGVIGSGNLEENNNVEEVATPAEPAPVAPAAEAPVTAAPAAAPADAPKKKSKVGLIVTLIIVFLLLIGGGLFFLFFFVLRGTTPNILNDSISKLLTSENVNATSTMEVPVENGKGLFDVKFSKAGSNIGLKAGVDMTVQKESLDLSLDASYIKGGNLYLRLNGVDNQLAIPFLSGFISSASGNSEAAGFYSLFLSMYSSVLKEMNGKWYKAGEGDFKKSGIEGGECTFEMLNILLSEDGLKAIADSYRANPFFEPKEGAEVKEDGDVKLIEVTVNEEKYKAFVSEIKKNGKFELTEKCKSSEDKDGEFIVGNIKDFSGIFGVNGARELVSVSWKNDKGEDQKLTLDYNKTDIEAPSDAKPLSDLLESFNGGGNLFGGNGGNGGGNLFGGNGGNGGGNLFGGNGSSDDNDDDDFDMDSLSALLQLLGGLDDSGNSGNSGNSGTDDLDSLFDLLK